MNHNKRKTEWTRITKLPNLSATLGPITSMPHILEHDVLEVFKEPLIWPTKETQTCTPQGSRFPNVCMPVIAKHESGDCDARDWIWT